MKRQWIKKLLTVSALMAIGLAGAGCSSEYNLATNREETTFIGTEKEIAIGDSIARQLQANYEFVHDIDMNERVQSILTKLEAVCDRRELVYSIRVIDDEQVNALSVPGGYIYILKGLMELVKNDDQLAGVIAHELGHITAKHGIKRLQSSYGYMVLQGLAISSGSADLAMGTSAIYTSLFYAYSQQDEFEADKLAVRYCRKAGYDANQIVAMMELLQQKDKKETRGISYFRTHPYYNERIAVLNKEISGRLGFRDYLNLTGSDQ